MRNRKLAISLALGALAAGCYAGYRRTQAARPAAKPEHLQTWEGEGGGVPLDGHRTAAQVRPVVVDGSAGSVRDSGLGEGGLRDGGLRDGSELDVAVTPR